MNKLTITLSIIIILTASCKRGSSKYYKSFLFMIFFFLPVASPAQDDLSKLRIGFNFALGKQHFFPYNSTDYIYNPTGYKFLINRPLKTGKLNFEVQIEPSLYRAKHQLLNESFVQPDYGPDYLLKRIIYMRPKIITEYVLSVGFIIRYNFNDTFSSFLMGSIGPMYSDTDTERMTRGFAFSDIAAFGVTMNTKKITFEIRPGVRHVSNADLRYPNCGYNSATVDFGLSFKLPRNSSE